MWNPWLRSWLGLVSTSWNSLPSLDQKSFGPRLRKRLWTPHLWGFWGHHYARWHVRHPGRNWCQQLVLKLLQIGILIYEYIWNVTLLHPSSISATRYKQVLSCGLTEYHQHILATLPQCPTITYREWCQNDASTSSAYWFILGHFARSCPDLPRPEV